MLLSFVEFYSANRSFNKKQKLTFDNLLAVELELWVLESVDTDECSMSSISFLLHLVLLPPELLREFGTDCEVR